MSWYVKEQSKDGSFSYPQDWGGFNLPVDIISKVHELGIDDPNHYDSLMFALYRMISAQCDGAYLIGVGKGVELDEHEMTHAMLTSMSSTATRSSPRWARRTTTSSSASSRRSSSTGDTPG